MGALDVIAIVALLLLVALTVLAVGAGARYDDY